MNKLLVLVHSDGDCTPIAIVEPDFDLAGWAALPQRVEAFKLLDLSPALLDIPTWGSYEPGTRRTCTVCGDDRCDRAEVAA